MLEFVTPARSTNTDSEGNILRQFAGVNCRKTLSRLSFRKNLAIYLQIILRQDRHSQKTPLRKSILGDSRKSLVINWSRMYILRSQADFVPLEDL